MVRGLISGKKYSENNIFDRELYPRMKEEPLLDEDDCLVIPVRNANTPHFRRLGNPSFGNRLGRDENNPTHDNCVQLLLDKLSSNNIKNIKFSTYVFENDVREEQIVFSPQDDSNYLWCKESDCRIAFEDGTYIQPDIAGRDSNKFSPRSAYPNIIIEVVRTHSPDSSTFRKLFELSKTNYHIYFYFIAEDENTSKLNHYKTVKNELTVRLSHYLIGGELFKNGNLYAPQGDNETYDHWFQYLENSYFTVATENA